MTCANNFVYCPKHVECALLDVSVLIQATYATVIGISRVSVYKFRRKMVFSSRVVVL